MRIFSRSGVIRTAVVFKGVAPKPLDQISTGMKTLILYILRKILAEVNPIERLYGRTGSGFPSVAGIGAADHWEN